MDNNHIIVAGYDPGGHTRTRSAYQYDYGQILRLEGFGEMLPQTFEMHFGIGGGKSITMIGQDGDTEIPDQCLTKHGTITAWLYLHDTESDGETRYVIETAVKPRAEITNQEPTPVQQDVITQAIAALNNAVEETAGAVTDAENARDEAETAAQNAETQAATAGRQALNAFNSAQSAANSASQASGSASAASRSATSASSSASSATASAQSAQAAANSIMNATAAADTLEPGSSATATVENVGGVITFELGIPRGDRGEQGIQGPVGPTGAKGDRGEPGYAVVEVSETQPTEEINKLWILEDSEESVSVPSQEEFSALEDIVDAKQDAPSSGTGAAGQVLGLNNSLNPTWINVVTATQVTGNQYRLNLGRE